MIPISPCTVGAGWRPVKPGSGCLVVARLTTAIWAQGGRGGTRRSTAQGRVGAVVQMPKKRR